MIYYTSLSNYSGGKPITAWYRLSSDPFPKSGADNDICHEIDTGAFYTNVKGAWVKTVPGGP